MQAEDTLTARPSQVFLGSLEYGAAESKIIRRTITLTSDQPWTLKQVDLSHAPGITTQILKDGPKSKEIECTIDTRAIVQDLPFGAFLKRLIRIETDLESSPQILIPVTGMLSINKTPRDFSTFVYLGQKRWQGKWGTPNMAGSVLAVALVLLAGLAAPLFSPFKSASGERFRLLMAGTAGIALLTGAWWLGLTYSRGSWIAFLAGLGVLACLQKPARLWVAGAAVLFLLRIWLLPAGGDRLASSAALEEDKSIANRLLVWQGALRIMGDAPLTGTGPNSFETTFARYYQTAGHQEGYSTAINDFLTWGAERGTLLLSIVVGGAAYLMFRCTKSAWKKEDVWIAGPVAALATIAVASSFSTLWFVRDYQFLFWLSLLMLLGYDLAQLWRKTVDFPSWSHEGLGLVVFMLLTGLVFFTAGRIALLSQPTRHTNETVLLEDRNLSLLRFAPSSHPPKGLVLYLPDAKESANDIARSTLRPLAALGWEVWSPEQACPPDTLTALISKLHAQSTLSLFLAGHRAGATEALQSLPAAASSRPLIAAFHGARFAPETLLSESSFPPTLLFQSLYDDQTSANPALVLQRRLQESPASHRVILDPNEVSYRTESWQEWLKAMDAFFKEQAPLLRVSQDQG